MYDSFLVSVSSSWVCVRERRRREKRTHIDSGYNPFTSSFETSFTPMGVHDPRKAQKGSGGGEPRWRDKIGEHVRGKGGGEGVLIIYKRREGHPIFQGVVQVLGLVMSNLFEDGHNELELVFRHDNRSREVGLLSLGLGTTLGVTGPRGDCPLSTGAFPASLFVILIQPLLIALVHVVNKSIVESVGDGLFDSTRPTKVSAGVLPVVGWIELVVIVH